MSNVNYGKISDSVDIADDIVKPSKPVTTKHRIAQVFVGLVVIGIIAAITVVVVRKDKDTAFPVITTTIGTTTTTSTTTSTELQDFDVIAPDLYGHATCAIALNADSTLCDTAQTGFPFVCAKSCNTNFVPEFNEDWLYRYLTNDNPNLACGFHPAEPSLYICDNENTFHSYAVLLQYKLYIACRAECPFTPSSN